MLDINGKVHNRSAGLRLVDGIVALIYRCHILNRLAFTHAFHLFLQILFIMFYLVYLKTIEYEILQCSS